MRRYRHIGFGLAFLLIGTAAEAAECTVPDFRFNTGVTLVRMLTGRNLICDFHIDSDAPTRGSNGILDIRITRKPHHGTAGRVENHIAYKPDPNFIGTDQFDVVSKFDFRGIANTVHLHVDVTVAN